ncbi:hypothetical protein KTQ89_05520 [Holdemanella porci]|uniref:hypothetical protein n=1 Tax=Holdemanella porci TaxID=2652276 RepID=UPI001C2C0BF5|nr:hypothetical protein [Holdemanella porci]MBU9871820.1 hypothetical protein [Holdemanella porci]
MDIIIRTSRLQRKAIQNALLFYIHLQNTNFALAFKRLAKNGFIDSEAALNDSYKENALKMQEYVLQKTDKSEEGQKTFKKKKKTVEKWLNTICDTVFPSYEESEENKDEILLYVPDVTEEELYILKDVLEFYMRIALGQWDEFTNSISPFLLSRLDDVKPYYTYRDQIFNIYNRNGHYDMASSFGIGSKKLQEGVRRCYEMEHEILNQLKIAPYCGIYSMKWANDSERMPGVCLEAKYLFQYDGDKEKAIRQLDDMSLQKKHYSSSINKNCLSPYRIFSDQPDILYLPIRNQNGVLYEPLEKGMYVYQKRNGYYVISKYEIKNVMDQYPAENKDIYK